MLENAIYLIFPSLFFKYRKVLREENKGLRFFVTFCDRFVFQRGPKKSNSALYDHFLSEATVLLLIDKVMWQLAANDCQVILIYYNVFTCRYGIGMIYYKQEKFNLAEIHFRKALSINPSSSVLYCHVGVVS